MGKNQLSNSSCCVHHEPGWSTHPEIARWVAPVEGRYCIVCLDWVRERDRQQFLRYVRDALAAGKTESEIAQALTLDDTADPFAPLTQRTYFQILLSKSGYRIRVRQLERIKNVQ